MDSLQQKGSYQSHQGMEVREEEVHTEEKMEVSVRKRHLPMDNTNSLETKFAREAEKIIKLRVNADAANWELKERIKSLEATKDRQQQNLVKLQREYEALDTRLQNELRNRENLINKMSNTRQICAAVERHASSAIETLAGCDRNRETLSDGYEMAATAINTLKEQFQEFQKRQQQQLQTLEDKYAAEVKIHKLSQEKWQVQIKQNEDIIAHLKKERELQVELNNVNCLKIEEVIKEKDNTIEKLIKQNDAQKDLNNIHIQKIEELTKSNEKTKRFLIMKSEEIVSLNAQHALFVENSAQKITELDMQIKDSNILMLAKDKELERINLLLTEEKHNIGKLKETEEMMKKQYEETTIQLGAVEESYKNQSEKLAYTMKANSEMVAKCEEFNILSEKLKESLESQQELCNEANKRLDKSEAELEIIKTKHEEDMSSLQANLTAVTTQLNENVSLAEEETKKKEENLRSLNDTINSLMRQLTVSTEARAKVEMANQQLRQERQILSDLHKETELINEKRQNIFNEDFENLKKMCDDKIIECENLIKMNTYMKNELASQKTCKVDTKVPERKFFTTLDTAHVESSTMETDFKSNPVSVRKKPDPILNLSAVKLSKNQKQGAKKTEDKDAFLSDSSFEGFVYDMNLVKQHYTNMKSIPEQPNSTTKPRSDHPSQERESKIPKKKKKIFSFVKNQ